MTMPTRKLVIDVDLRASSEVTLDIIEEQLRNKFAPGEWLEERVPTTNLRRSAFITAAEISNEGPVEI